jgi:aspartate/methionine/tyrosine aminotransferase
MLEIPLSGIKKIEEIVRTSDEYISLSQGAVKLGGIPQQIKDHLQSVLKTEKTDYYGSCWGLKELREKLVNVLSVYDPALSVDNIMPTHGSCGGLALLFLSLLQSGDEVIIPEPAYPAYLTLTHVTRTKPVFVSILKDNADGSISAELNIEAIKAAVTPKTKIIVFSNPWNPLANVIPLSTINELLAWCQEQEIFLVVDEAYRDYAYTNTFESSLSLVTKSDWLICASTFSKNFAMSGWRVGFLAIPKRLGKIAAGMQDAILNCLNNTAQYAALYALDHPEFSQQFHVMMKENRDLTLQMLEPLIKKGIMKALPADGGIYVFLKTDQQDATDLCMSILYKAKVAMIPGSSFGPSGAPFMRLCYAREKHVLEEGIDRLVKFFD